MSLSSILDRLAGPQFIPRRKKRLRPARFLVETLENRVLLTTYTVNTTNPGLGGPGETTLTDALLLLNADTSNSDADTINFDITLDATGGPTTPGVQTIEALVLPTITHPVIIDATTQPGYSPGRPMVDIDGSRAATSDQFDGLVFKVGGNTVHGLIINNFQHFGIVLDGTNDPNHGQGPGLNNRIQENFIGTDASGENAAPNNFGGIDIVNSSYNQIGGLNADRLLLLGNLISGNQQEGVFLSTGTDSHNYIEGNYIGTDIDGLKPIANAQAEVDGVALVPPLDQPDNGYASNNVIGNFDPIEGEFDPNGRNIIAGNTADGVLIVGGTGNRVAGNYIGLAWDGLNPLPNGFDGVHLEDASSNIIGGTEDGARNIISGNSQNGVTIDSDAATYHGLAIPASKQSSKNNRIVGNYIGTDFSGASFVPNGNPSDTGKNRYGEGVALKNLSDDPTVFVSNNTIGGADGDDGAVDGNVHAQNLISGNWDNGILMAGTDLRANKVAGDYIGTDITGKHPLPNSNFGVLLTGITGSTDAPSENLIGSTAIGGGNLISGNGTSAESDVAATGGGVAIANGASANFVANNLIGTDASGLKFLPNAGDGVLISAAADLNTIGGDSDDSENVISGNEGNGVTIVNSTANFVEKNFLGVGLDGSTRLPNTNGVALIGSSDNVIGFVQTVGSQQNNLGNVIAANSGAGISVSAQSNSNQVLGNMIGADLGGTDRLGNGGAGISIDGSTGNQIGGTTTVARNVIVFNGSDGIDIENVVNNGQSPPNLIEGDYVGIGPDGIKAEGNTGDGILINNSSSNTIGSGTLFNVISNNDLNGVVISGEQSQNNTVSDSDIGTTADGNSAAPNGANNLFGSGVVITSGASLNNIGGDTISGNQVFGIFITGAGPKNSVTNNYIGTNAQGSAKLGGATTQYTGVLIDGTPATTIGGDSIAQGGNVISGNENDGISVGGSGSTGTVIASNYIGTDSFATAPIGNGLGIYIAAILAGAGAPTDTTVDGNTISGNLKGGLELAAGTSATHVTNNFIGTNFSEIISSALSNFGFGIEINDAPGNFIGEANAGNGIVNTLELPNQDTTVGDGDALWITGPASMNNDVADETIVDNAGDGIEISAGASANKIGNTQSNVVVGNLNGIVITDSGTRHNTVQNNFIGIGKNGETKGNKEDGVAVMDGASNNTIGAAATEGASNIISANGDNGIEISGESTSDNTVLGNFVGTDLNGKFQKGQGFGNTLAGIEVSAPDNFIGGSSTGEGNVIVGNSNGISLDFSTTAGVIIEGDKINNNRFDGIVVNNGAFSNHIGGPDDADANTIHDNGADGVLVVSGSQISIQHNTIFNNTKLGIELAPGANAEAPAPFLSLATPTRIAGWLQAAPNTTYTIEFFSGTVAQNPDGSESDDAEHLVQPLLLTRTPSGELAEQPFQQVETNGSGVGLFDLALGQSPAVNAVIRATATDANINTSAFSNAVTVGADSNADGVPDSQQNGNISANNVSFPDALNPGDPSRGIPPAFVSLKALDVTNILDVWSTPDPDPNHQNGPPANTQFPFGFVSFSLVGVDAPPTPSLVTLTFPDTGATPTSYWRYVQPQGDRLGHWYQWDWDGNPRDTGAQIMGNTIILHFIDGAVGDDDGVANGIIVDAGSPGFSDPYTVFTTADSGLGSLRQAILSADANAFNTITFDLPGSGPQTIQLLSPLPAITASVAIDGSTEPGFSGTPVVVLDGSQAGPGADGLTVAGGFATIKDLVIDRFSDDGIHVLTSGSATIVGNYLGAGPSGRVAEGNGLYGIEIENNSQGDDEEDDSGGQPSMVDGANVISGNTAGGLFLHGVGASGNVVTSNFIGAAADGISPLGNGGPGVLIDDDASGNDIGFRSADAGNTIAYNAGAGVDILNGTFNSIQGNSIFANGALGIDLGGDGVTPNDSGDSDGVQNYPVLASAASYGGRTFISGTFNSAPDLFYTIDFYASDTADPSGFGQGQFFLGSISVGADDGGEASFDVNLAAAAPGAFITATATLFNSYTSEFSAALALTPSNPLALIVNTTDDADDAVPDPTHFSLREAIMAADARPGQDIIDFDLPNLNRVIPPQSALPDITDPVIIDGTSQPGFQGLPLVEIAGSHAGAAADGLRITGGGSVVRGLDIEGFQNDVTLSGTGGNELQGNFLGADITGTSAGPGDVAGVYINNSANNIIGGASAAQRNVAIQIVIDGSGSSGNVVEGNYITTDLTGTALLLGAANPLDNNVPAGVLIADGASSNTIGGAAAGAQNVIAAGIAILSGDSNVVAGNLIGTDFSGTKLLARLFSSTIGAGQSGGLSYIYTGRHGIIVDSDSNVIGGTLPGDRNIVTNGITLQGNENVVQGNYIGTDITGKVSLATVLTTIPLANQYMFGNPTVLPDGLEVTGNYNQIGGATPGAGNVISGFSDMHGVVLSSDVLAAYGSPGVLISGQYDYLEGNLIGADATGTKPLPNNTGVLIDGLNDQIGGMDPGAGNVISGNQSIGIEVASGGNGAVIEGNYVGADRTGAQALGNGLVTAYSNGVTAIAALGIEVSASNVVIGGSQPGAGNVISGNGGDGIAAGFPATANFRSSSGEGTGLTIEGNYIGLDATGKAPLGNAGNGIEIILSANTVIGGTLAGDGNVISTNGGDGIHVDNTEGFPAEIVNGSPGTVIQGNTIGADPSGTEHLGNGGDGVSISTSVFGVSADTVGGAEPGAGNLIAFNGGYGVDIPSGQGNTIRGNDIRDNGGLGLLTNVNDAAASYAENRGIQLPQAAPVLTSAVFDPQGTVVSGSLTGAPFTRYEIDFFANDSVNPAGFGDGQSYLQSISVLVDDTGSAEFQIPLDEAVPIGQWITATATPDTTDGNTSMFSRPAPVAAATGNTFQFSSPNYLVTETGGAAAIVVTRSGDTSGTATVDYATGGGTAAAGVNYTAESGTLTFAAGVTSQTIAIPVADDGLADGNMNFQILISNPGGASLGAVNDADVTIADSDAAGEIEFASPDYYFDLGAAQAPATFTLTRTGGSAGTVRVDFAVTGGAAVSDTALFSDGVPLGNFSNNAGTVTFAPGQTTAQLTFLFSGIAEGFAGTTAYQGPLTIDMTLGNPTGGATLGAITTSTLTIDYAEVQHGAFAIAVGTGGINFAASVTTSQVGANGGTAQIAVGRIGNLSATEMISYTTVDGTANAGTNYIATHGTLTFLPGDNVQDIEVPVLGGPHGSTETFQVVLSDPTGGAYIVNGSGSWTVTIVGGNLPLTTKVEVAPNQSFDGDGGSALVAVDVLNSPPPLFGTFLYQTSDGTAKAGADYEAVLGALSFQKGDDAPLRFSVPLLSNSLTSGSLTFFVTLFSGPSGLIDNTPVPITLVYKPEGQAQFASAGYPVAKNDAELSVTVIGRPNATVDYATNDGTAVAATDYTPVSGTLTFGATGTSTITIPILNDLVSSGNKTFSLTLTNPKGGLVLGNVATTTITVLDENAQAQSTTKVTSAAGGGSTYGQAVTLTATVSAASGTPTGSVDFVDTTTGQDLGPSQLAMVNGIDEASVMVSSLVAGPHTIVATYTSDNNSIAGSHDSLTQTVALATLTVTADNKAMVYGTLVPTLTDTITGFVNGDTASAVIGVASLSTAATSASGVGNYAITAGAGTLAAANYSFAFVDGSLTVTPAALTITANNQTMTYGGTLPTLTVTYTGLENGDAPATFSTSPNIAPTVTAPATNHVGTYTDTIVASGASDPDYTISYAAGTLTVTPAALTISANDQTMTYGGTLPALTVSYTGLANGDMPATFSRSPNIAPTVNAPAINHVGTYTGVIVASGASDPDYTVSYAPGTLNVTPAALTVSADNKTKVYGAANPSLTDTITGFVNGDTSSVVSGMASLNTAATSASGVGNYTVTVGRGTLSAADYTFDFVNATLSVDPATLTVTADARMKTYGDADPTLTYQATGFKISDTAGTALSGTLSRAAGETVAGSPYAIGQGTLAANANYAISFTGSSLSITPATLTVTADARTKVYGAANPTFTDTITGFVNGDTSSVVSGSANLSASATTISGVGKYDITVGQGTLSAANYTFAYVNGTLTITDGAAQETLDGVGLAINGYELSPLVALAIATFSSSDPAEQASAFTATIHWGDGASSLGTVALSGTRFTVSGSHTYGDEGSFSIEIDVADAQTSTTIASTAQIEEELLAEGTHGTADQRFITEIYRDVLGRQAEPQGRDFWVGHLARGDGRSKVVEDILAAVTEEYHVDLIQAEFERYLRRAPEPVAMHYFTGLLDAGGDAGMLDAILVSSPEYFDAHGGVNDRLLDALFGDALRRPVDADARKFYDDLFGRGFTRAQIADVVFASDEYRGDLVGDWYEQYLDRSADAADLAPFVDQLDAGVPGERVTAVMLASDEFHAKTGS